MNSKRVKKMRLEEFSEMWIKKVRTDVPLLLSRAIEAVRIYCKLDNSCFRSFKSCGVNSKPGTENEFIEIVDQVCHI